MNSIAATPVLRPPTTRLAPSLEEERTAAATVAASGGDAQPQQGPKFSDVVAILNPLQNLPIVGAIYRDLTGDVPHPSARAIGGLLWGGPLGLVGAVFTYVAEQVSGKSITEIAKSIFDGGGSAPALAEQPAATAGTPRSLLPANAAAAAEDKAAVAPPAARPQTAAASGTTINELRPRNAATRDLAFYQAHAGSRLPPASSGAAPGGGPQASTQPASFHRPVGPVLGGEPIGARVTPAAPAAAPRVDAAAAAPTSAAPATLPPASSQDFMQRMMRGIDQYQAINRGIEAQSRATRLDRVE